MSAADEAYDRIHGVDGHTQTATIRRVSRPRGEPTKNEAMLMARLKERAEVAAKDYRDCVVSVLNGGASFTEVAKVTGLSTNTLQRWKRETAD